METKAEHSLLGLYRVHLDFTGKLVVDKIRRIGGLCIFWSDKVSVTLLSYSRFHINAQIGSHDLKVWHLKGMYGNPEPDQRCHAWTLIPRLKDLSTLPWLCFGDFNEILFDTENSGGSPQPRWLMENFREALNYCDLDDLDGFSGPRFTWSNKRDRGLVQERIDRAVCCYRWKQLFAFLNVLHLDFWSSDQRALQIEVLDVKS
ncbi:hypothetical protein Ddye_023836 [Dipteronia dyeriana]|uniref:Endonuclease/exonuclease/phosphatase domain-containing protein n=1 Tax=Dipteronia dyeriana TaxID=168575 RepID=A0AAD9TUB2_9ROSI|nr:hypothetical protein Ddye_023836 [Dipteronia dyeriana]